MPHTDLKRDWRNRGDKEPLYAIAYAIIELSDNVDRLGLNRNTETDGPGATENISIVLKEQLHEIAAAIYQNVE